MIFQLKGNLVAKTGLLVIIDVNGVGYGVLTPISTLLNLPEIGKEVLLHTHLVIRDDAHFLYGFLAEKEKFLFSELIKISGFGPKSALAILSHLNVEQFLQAIISQDLSKLIGIPGIGQKTAQRLIIEMQNKLSNKKFMELFSINNLEHKSITQPNLIEQNVINDAEEALISLGYKPKEAATAIKSALNSIDTCSNQEPENISLKHVNNNILCEQLIKLALKKLFKMVPSNEQLV